MKASLIAPVLALAVLLTACHEPADSQTKIPNASNEVGSLPPSDLRAVAMREGKRIVGEAFTLLSTNLFQAIQQGGITNALSVCSVKALPLTQLVGDTNQVKLSRVSHKTRNSANQPSETELKILTDFQGQIAGKTNPPSPVVTSDAAGRLTFYAPIVLNNPLCLNCHGTPDEQIPPEVVALLEKLYPQDEATGFSMGELRGMWRVAFGANAFPAD